MEELTEVEVSILRLHGPGRYAHHCRECGVGVKRWHKNRSGLCRTCSSKRSVKLMNERNRERRNTHLNSRLK